VYAGRISVSGVMDRDPAEYNHPKNADREFRSQTLSPDQYVYLIERVHKDKELGDYFDKELRYGFD
jgi:hypothetical protein